ncbi:MAG TPA: carboxymuconolactone decarboxylase family protein [Gemmatimonadaceae bacterium]|nr:carboxymuconolactone decarboxylase family protein [Gemmatimonadaceae bacterium]
MSPPAAQQQAANANHAHRVHDPSVLTDAHRTMRGLESYMRQSTLEKPLIELVKMRASYINGCAYCIDMHSKDARHAGETEQRLYAVPVWRETPFYTPRERAALAWTEAVTEIYKGGVSDELFTLAREHFTERELVDLTMAVVAINGWNRLAITFHAPVGTYVPGAHG